METAPPRSSSLLFFLFKSYYVVWKLSARGKSIGGTVCLNRTMQYGNNSSGLYHLTAPSQFKSYYVVWKRKVGQSKYGGSIWFKSYYVVWKLFTLWCRKNRMFRFKSYYVVWKPHISKTRFLRQACLNRTMQYGNFQLVPGGYADDIV